MRKHVLSFAGVAGALLVCGQAMADGFRFEAVLTGAQEVTSAIADPAQGVDTPTTGSLRLDVDEGQTRAEFRLVVRDGMGVTQAHLHCAPAGVNGSVAVFLFGFVPGGANVDGTLAQGSFTNADLRPVDFAANAACGVPVNNIAALVAAARAGRIYVNVHTLANPPGEVRGQLFVD